MSTHVAIALTAPHQTSEITVPTKCPGAGEVRIRVGYVALIPPDLYQVDKDFYVDSYPVILGFTASGTIDEVGEGVEGFEVGDKVTSFVYLNFTDRATQEYIVQPTFVVAKVPSTITLEEAAAIPDNFVCALYVAFHELGLPIPSSFPVPESEAPPLADAPILVYGASSTAGLFLVQLLSAAGYRKIIATASPKNHGYLRSLGAHATFDYRSVSLVDDVAAVSGGHGAISLAVDCISTTETAGIVSRLVGKRAKAKVAILLPIKEGDSIVGDKEGVLYQEFPKDRNPFGEEIDVIYVRTFTYQKDEYLKNNVMPRILPTLLESGIIKPPRVRLLEKGSFKERVEEGLDLIRQNKISGEKVVVKVDA